MSQDPLNLARSKVDPDVVNELEDFRDWIKKFRAQKIGDVKMQKIRLQLGTYAQRQDGVQMQRIKIPGGMLNSEQLEKLADLSDRYATGFLHVTTRQDVQIYYLKLEDCPDLMIELASVGITTREACGNTVRNITASHLSGTSPEEPFDVRPYCIALYQFLVRNKYNQVMGRKFKIAFEGCGIDYAGLRFHDFGFQAVVRDEGGRARRGFRVYVGGGLGGMPALGMLYTDFLPEEELMNLAAATLRVFDRYGERKNRMAARMKYLIKKIGWEKFRELVDYERKEVNLEASVNDYLKEAHREQKAPSVPENLPQNPELQKTSAYEEWLRDSVWPHKFPGYKGVQIRLKLGDILTDPARKVAEIARVFSRSELRITMAQNLFLPWVPEKALPAVYQALSEVGLAQRGVETLEDVTTCPGADTCRLGITSAKGLGAGIAEAMNNGLGKYRELSRDIKIKVSGCPNGCAQHNIANIGFQGAALKKDGKTVPSHEVFLGGLIAGEKTTYGDRLGKFPARNGVKLVEKLLDLFSAEREGDESFNECMQRVGKERIRELIAPLAEIPSFEQDPSFYEDWGHENEKFSIRTGIKGECAGTTIQEKSPVMEDAREKLAQAEAFLLHKEFANAQIEAYETMAQAVRVPLYVALVDPFTAQQALWEFENIFVRANRAPQEWLHFADKMEKERDAEPSEERARMMIDQAKKLIVESERLHQELIQPASQKINPTH